jgi:hypothetical protein
VRSGRGLSGTPPLHIGRSEVHNIFELVGDDEDSISLAIAWGLKMSPKFLKGFLASVLDRDTPNGTVTLRVHRHEAEGGITDLEIEAPGSFKVIVEAKRGWILPGKAQLQLYAKRVGFVDGTAKMYRLVTMSECSAEYARTRQKTNQIGGVPLRHLSWKGLVAICRAAGKGGPHKEQRLLQELVEYLESVMTSQPLNSNQVFVVSLGAGGPKGGKTSWVEVVTKYGKYFHPVGNHWPKEPANYVGFRSGGRLQSIHFVEGYQVIENLKDACPGMPNKVVAPHFLYRLGKAIVPSQDVRNGSVWPSGRVWCALDTLLTCKTVSEARDVTAKRQRATA